jgi:hypothetical protein
MSFLTFVHHPYFRLPRRAAAGRAWRRLAAGASASPVCQVLDGRGPHPHRRHPQNLRQVDLHTDVRS